MKMKKILLLLLVSISGYSQIDKDSIIERKVDKSFYFRSMPLALTSDGFTDVNGNAVNEKLKNRLTQNIEFGESFGVLDVGLCIGRINTVATPEHYLAQRSYIEPKVIMNACQIGIFSNEISIGAGYVPKSQTPILLELSSTIFAQIDDNFGIGVIYGTYELTGDTLDYNKSFTGIFIRYGLIRDGGFLFTKTRISHKKLTSKKISHIKTKPNI
jgi:hypothetical protein